MSNMNFLKHGEKRMSAQQQAYLDAPRRQTHIFHEQDKSIG
jgi:hypothetical protein